MIRTATFDLIDYSDNLTDFSDNFWENSLEKDILHFIIRFPVEERHKLKIIINHPYEGNVILIQNKNSISKFLSINVAENILSLLPKNTHDPKLFIKPIELESLAKIHKLKIKSVQGIAYNPILKTFKLSNIDLVNYFATLIN